MKVDYETQGFEINVYDETGLRKRFYERNEEDAVKLARRICREHPDCGIQLLYIQYAVAWWKEEE